MIIKTTTRTSLLIKWLDSKLPTQGAQVQLTARELDPTCCKARSHMIAKSLQASTKKKRERENLLIID